MKRCILSTDILMTGNSRRRPQFARFGIQCRKISMRLPLHPETLEETSIICVCVCVVVCVCILRPTNLVYLPVSVHSSLHGIPGENERTHASQHEYASCAFTASSMTKANIPAACVHKHRYSHNAVWEKLMKASPACESSEEEGEADGELEKMSHGMAGGGGGEVGGSATKRWGGNSGSGRKGLTLGRAFGNFLSDNVLRSRTRSQERKRRRMSGDNSDSAGNTPSSGGFKRL